MNSITIQSLFDLNYATNAADLFADHTYPWEILPLIHDYVLAKASMLDLTNYDLYGEHVWIHDDAKVADTSTIIGPCIIGPGAEIRPGAYIRGSVIIGKNAVIGNSTEIKNAIIFDEVQVPHYNYIGDSILGHKAHMGAGAITSNIKADKLDVIIKSQTFQIETGLRKIGAMIGDGCDIGCNSVLNPGTIIGKNTNIYPLSMVRGIISANCIYKNQSEIVSKQ